MTEGQYFDGGICPTCDINLPILRDEGGWGLARCPKCKKYFNTTNYKDLAGGKFHIGTGCRCDACWSLEN